MTPGDESNQDPTALDELIGEILADAYGDDEELWALRQVIEDEVSFPCDGFVIGEPVSVVEIDYDGNERRGLTATCLRVDGSRHVVAASDIVFLRRSPGARYIACYRRWMGLEPFPLNVAAMQRKTRK